MAGSLRREARPFAMAAGVVTALAGLLFIVNPETHFFPTVVPIIAWLLVRSVILLGALTETAGRSGAGPRFRPASTSCSASC